MKVIRIVALATLILIAACSKQDDPQPVAPPLTEKDFSALTSIMQNSLSGFGGNAGLLLMDKDGKVLYKQYFGSYSDNSFIAIASGSKLPSMVTVMALADKGLMSLNDKVSSFYPIEFSANDRKDVTLRQLLIGA
jgi:CubicO group peptidase (beta-lactamase class C family)